MKLRELIKVLGDVYAYDIYLDNPQHGFVPCLNRTEHEALEAWGDWEVAEVRLQSHTEYGERYNPETKKVDWNNDRRQFIKFTDAGTIIPAVTLWTGNHSDYKD